MVGELVRHKLLDKAVALVEEAYGLNGGRPGIVPGSTIEGDALDKLVHGLSQQGRAEEGALPLLDRLCAAKVPVSSRLYASVFGGGSGAGGGGGGGTAKERGHQVPARQEHRGSAGRSWRPCRCR
mmetsp:Transcript_140534/g.449170  ORF Transcript_140534/g.449170 Transcript_140534/m.449170 type:complete len:125 (-) Transcript_140534:95-469(-)